ncbi:MAG: hypothetical protein AAF355_10265 [Myxococcota bacterium]
MQTEVIVVLAREEAGRIDPSLQQLPALQRPPFTTFRSMEVESRPRVRLVAGRPSEVALPNGRRLRILLERIMPDGRFQVKVSIDRPRERDYLPLLQVVASAGDPFFIAGQAYAGGTLVVGVRVGESET